MQGFSERLCRVEKKCRNSPEFLAVKFCDELSREVRVLELKRSKSRVRNLLISNSYCYIEEFLEERNLEFVLRELVYSLHYVVCQHLYVL